MGKVEIVSLQEVNDELKLQAAEIFVDGFFDMFRFSRDKNVIKEFIYDSMLGEMFYVAIKEDLVVGLLGYGDYKKRALKLKKETCKKLFGKIKGFFVYKQAGYIMEKPAVFHEKECYIDYVATRVDYRKQGVATELLKMIMEDERYNSYDIEVLEKNAAAKKLYESLGFITYKCTKDVFTYINGFGAILKMTTRKDW